MANPDAGLCAQCKHMQKSQVSLHVDKLAFGLSPHGKPSEAPAEATRQLSNMSMYSPLPSSDPRIPQWRASTHPLTPCERLLLRFLLFFFSLSVSVNVFFLSAFNLVHIQRWGWV